MTANILSTLKQLGFEASSADHTAFYESRSKAAFAAGTWGPGADTTIGMKVYAADYQSPDCPDGWETFLGYLARTEPEVLSMMDQLPSASEQDDHILEDRCRERGVVSRVVSACSWLVREGVFEARAYPIPLIAAYTGVAA
jgi:hypothetical protein